MKKYVLLPKIVRDNPYLVLEQKIIFGAYLGILTRDFTLKELMNCVKSYTHLDFSKDITKNKIKWINLRKRKESRGTLLRWVRFDHFVRIFTEFPMKLNNLDSRGD